MRFRTTKPLCIFLTALVAGVALSITARSNGDMRQETQVQKNGQTNGEVQLVASIAKERFGVGQTITLKVVLKNNSDDERRLISSGARKDYKLDVRYEGGKLAAFTTAGDLLKRSEGLSISTGRIVLKPGEEHEDDILLTERYDLTAPGSYIVIVKRHGPERDGKNVTLKSNKVIVTIE